MFTDCVVVHFSGPLCRYCFIHSLSLPSCLLLPQCSLFVFFSTHFLANFHCCNIVTIMLIYLVNINKCNIVTVILIYLVNILCSHCRSMLFAFLASVCCSTVWVLLWTFYFVTSFWHLSNKCYNIHVSLCSVNLLYLCDSSTQIFTSAKEVMFFAQCVGLSVCLWVELLKKV